MKYNLGVHCSVSGGLENAFTEAKSLQTDAMQIFTRNQRQWEAKPITEEERSTFLKASKSSEMGFLFSHCSYLINMAAENEEIRLRSVNALKQEVERCTQLGLHYCVLHPGAAGNQEMNTAIEKIAAGLREVLTATAGSKVMILIENTAGQGSSVGGPFDNLKQIYQATGSDRIGYCFDTCHAFAAGYDIRTESGCLETLESFDTILGLDKLKVFHLNDSKGELGKHLDRHEHIGKGKIGTPAFKVIMKQFTDKPKVLETPKEDDWDNINLQLLRSFV